MQGIIKTATLKLILNITFLKLNLSYSIQNIILDLLSDIVFTSTDIQTSSHTYNVSVFQF